MELTQHGFLEELLNPRRETWASFPTGVNDQYFPSGWNFNSLDENPTLVATNPSFLGFSAPTEPSFEFHFGDRAHPFVDGFTVPEVYPSSYAKNEACLYAAQNQDYPSMVEEDGIGLLRSDCLKERQTNFTVEVVEQANNIQAFDMGLYGEKKKKNKKLEGQPSKNLMAERRRRKRLNDRLSMLRSIVPKISKMDRTSILGDTIDYVKELLERVKRLQEEKTQLHSNQLLMDNFAELKSNEVLVRNSPKFDVERRETDTRIDICCSSKPGLLLSTVSTLEALGLGIQQCVISCFSDFSMQATCSEVPDHRTLLGSEDIKQALFRNAGYGGRYL